MQIYTQFEHYFERPAPQNHKMLIITEVVKWPRSVLNVSQLGVVTCINIIETSQTKRGGNAEPRVILPSEYRNNNYENVTRLRGARVNERSGDGVKPHLRI